MKKKGEMTRRKIVEKSLQLFSVKGFFNTSISDILHATGLTKGGLYGHFPSKEEIWYEVYDEAVMIWRKIVFAGVAESKDPLARIEKVVYNDLICYLGAEVFAGGCFFLNMLVELTGQSSRMSRHILRGFVRLSMLLQRWLKEAEEKGVIRPGLNHREIANFIVISVNGAAALYIPSRDRKILDTTITQIHQYLGQLKI